MAPWNGPNKARLYCRRRRLLYWTQDWPVPEPSVGRSISKCHYSVLTYQTRVLPKFTAEKARLFGAKIYMFA